MVTAIMPNAERVVAPFMAKLIFVNFFYIAAKNLAINSI
jgi:hypothetical protein